MRDAIIKKILSGRFFIAVSMTTTYCIILVCSVVLVAKGVISKDFFLGLFAGFSTMFGVVVKAYFDRNDRKAVDK